MPTLKFSAPKYRRHKATGQAVVTICGKDVYLGPYGSKASRSEYDRLIGEWLAAGRPTRRTAEGPPDFTVVEVIAAYWKFAGGYYIKNGKATDEQACIKAALKLLKQHYGSTRAAEFGPLALRAVQLRMIEANKSRGYINRNIDRIKRCFKWAVANEMVPVAVHQALTTVAGLPKGKSAARETEPVGPVSDTDIQATLPETSKVVGDMVRLQRLLGCRPGELCMMRPSDVQTGGDVWVYTPPSHKTEHYGRQRRIFIGSRGQDILRPYLLRPADRCCFLKPRSKKPFDTRDYHAAIRSACQRAGVPLWGPNRLRHTAATEIRAKFGLEAAQTVLGHASAKITEVYAERDQRLAAEIMAKIG